MRRTWHRMSLRARLLMIGVLGVATALAIGSVALYSVLTYTGYRTLDASASATASEVRNLVESGRLPDPIPVTGNQLVQVVDRRDRVVSASANGDRLTAVLLPGEIREALTGHAVEVPGSRVGLASPLRVVATRAEPAGRPASVVVVAQQFDELAHSQQVLRRTLLLTYPLLLAVLALIAWRVIGAALRPVEELRASAEQISDGERDERLPVPESRDEVGALAVTLNSMLDRITASRARQRAFVTDAAHELRSPLTSMQTQLEVSHRLGEDGPGSADLRAEVSRMSTLVEDLLVLARLDSEAVSPPLLPVDVRGLLEDVLGGYGERRVPVQLAPDSEDALVVRGRRESLRRALTNLVDNAVRHAASKVVVTAHRHGPRVAVEVHDDGGGVAPTDRERVFERFTRLDEARDRDAGGAGLGLAIVRGLLRSQGGDVELVDSSLGGLCARLLLPPA